MVKLDYYSWTKKIIKELKQALIDINKLPDNVEMQDIYYYILYYKFHNKILTEQIKNKVKELHNELL